MATPEYASLAGAAGGSEPEHLLEGDSRLVAAILAGDRKATAEFVSRYADQVYRYVVARLIPRTDLVEDLVQDIFLAAWEHLASFRTVGTFSTGGLGFGSGNDPLGSQGSLVLSDDGHFLFAVNAGSNDISVMQAGAGALMLVGTFPSGGTEPTSLALYKDLLYVLNAGGTPNITGFELNPEGTLTMLPGSSRPLAGGTAAGPAQVSFTPDGSSLVVTEKNTNLIDTYHVLPSGLADGPVSNNSNGVELFGFTFGRAGALVVSEVAGGSGGTSAASSYQISTPDGSLTTVSPSVGDTQMAACWAVATNDGRFVYLVNSASGTLSSYRVGPGGQLALLNATAGTTGSSSTPLDAAITSNGAFLYVLDDATGGVSAFQIGSDGSLRALSGATGLPSGSQGIAAR